MSKHWLPVVPDSGFGFANDYYNKTASAWNTQHIGWKFVHPMPPTLETPRLLLRPLELADAEQAQVLFPHWEIVRYLDNIVPWLYPPDGAYTWYRNIALPQMERGEEWHWALRLKSSPASMIGSISLKSKENNNRGF